MNDFAVRGNILWSSAKNELAAVTGYAVCAGGKCAGIFPQLPEEYQGLPVQDFGDCLIIPGMTDLHIHAPQYAFRGTNMDVQLLEWLRRHAFPEEAKFRDPDYARRAYGIFADDLRAGVTTRACVFASAHTEATEILMELLSQAGLGAYVGRVNMDYDAPDILREPDAEFSAVETLRWLEDTQNRYERVQPILTPRFVLSCTRELLERLRDIEDEYGLPVQSHLSENLGEIAAVAERFPEFPTYGEVYDHYHLFGSRGRTLMAHCVYSSEREIELLRERGVFIAHCPASNTDVITGIAPARKYLDLGLNLGLATDVAGGHTASMLHAVVDAIAMSKLYWRYVDDSSAPLTFPEAFYLATRGGGAFFGRVGSFEPGYEFDAVVLDDSSLRHPGRLSLPERLERAAYLGLDDRGGVCAKFVAGNRIM